jgi:RNA polymerase sigma factor (sigma-70 family)
MIRPNDKQADWLVERCKLGDPSYYKELYLKYASSMYNTALRIVKLEVDAEDIIQESFIEAFRQIEQFRYQCTFDAWLKRIVINKSINYITRDKKKELITAPMDTDILSEVITDNDEEDIEFSIQKIKEAVASLPDGYRIIYCLHAIEALSYEDIAEILEITPVTVRTQFFLARRKIILHFRSK